jgi:hypothetical protein
MNNESNLAYRNRNRTEAEKNIGVAKVHDKPSYSGCSKVMTDAPIFSVNPQRITGSGPAMSVLNPSVAGNNGHDYKDAESAAEISLPL